MEATGFTDMHLHILYGIDDGAATREVMERMLDQAHENGIGTLYCTSHQTPGIDPFPFSRYERHLQYARDYCAEKGYPITLYHGAEALYTPAMGNYMEHEDLTTLGDSDFVLLEFVPDVEYEEMIDAITLLGNEGYKPILAHIERYGCLFSHARPYKLKEAFDVRFQVNCGTVVRGAGFWRNGTVRRWFKDELIDCVASDAHNTDHRRNRMREAYEALTAAYGRAYADRLTHWAP